MIAALARAFGDLGDPRMRRYVWLSLAGALAAFAVLWTAVWVLLTQTAFFAIGWLDTAVDVLGGLAVLVLSWLLFPAVIGIVAGLLLEQVADAVERRCYPALDPARPQSLTEILRVTLKFTAVVVVFNLIVLPLYLVPVVNAVVFYGLNGYLLGREYYELVAQRRLDESQLSGLRRSRRGWWFLAGLCIAVMTTVPVLNLIAPIVATAFMVHAFHAVRR